MENKNSIETRHKENILQIFHKQQQQQQQQCELQIALSAAYGHRTLLPAEAAAGQSAPDMANSPDRRAVRAVWD